MNDKTIFSLLMGLILGMNFMNIPSALETLMNLYGASYATISILMSSLLWSHALMQIPGGMMTDRIGLPGVHVTSLVCIFIGNLISLTVPSLQFAVSARVIIGIGTGLSFVAVMKTVALYSDPGRVGMYQAFFGGFFSIGCILAYLLIPRLIDFGWQWAYLAPGFPCLLLLIMVFGLRFEQTRSTSPSPLPLFRILRIRAGWILGIYHALSYGSVLSLGNWVPSLLADALVGSSAKTFAWGGALVMLISGLGRLSGGVVLLRFSPVGIANSSLLTLSALFLCLLLVPMPAPVLILAIFAAWFGSINFGAIFHLASRSTSSDSIATLIGFVNFLANLGAIFLTLMFGWIRDATGSFSWGFCVLASFCLGAFLVGSIPVKKAADHKELVSSRSQSTDGRSKGKGCSHRSDHR